MTKFLWWPVTAIGPDKEGGKLIETRWMERATYIEEYYNDGLSSTGNVPSFWHAKRFVDEKGVNE